MQQLTLFDVDDLDELKKIRSEWEKTRKALFREMSICKKQYSELSHDHELLKLNICRGKITV